MKVSYRVIEEVTPDGHWENVGVIAFWQSAPPHLQLRGMLQHTVSRPVWRTIRQRATQRKLTLERYHEALEEYDAYYRIQEKACYIEGGSSDEIRKRLREKYIFVNQESQEPLLSQNFSLHPESQLSLHKG